MGVSSIAAAADMTPMSVDSDGEIVFDGVASSASSQQYTHSSRSLSCAGFSWSVAKLWGSLGARP